MKLRHLILSTAALVGMTVAVLAPRTIASLQDGKILGQTHLEETLRTTGYQYKPTLIQKINLLSRVRVKTGDTYATFAEIASEGIIPYEQAALRASEEINKLQNLRVLPLWEINIQKDFYNANLTSYLDPTLPTLKLTAWHVSFGRNGSYLEICMDAETGTILEFMANYTKKATEYPHTVFNDNTELLERWASYLGLQLASQTTVSLNDKGDERIQLATLRSEEETVCYQFFSSDNATFFEMSAGEDAAFGMSATSSRDE